MIRQEPTSEMIAEWKATWRAYKDKLHPNRKSGADIVNYFCVAQYIEAIKKFGMYDEILS